jgi:hypothetical protein
LKPRPPEYEEGMVTVTFCDLFLIEKYFISTMALLEKPNKTVLPKDTVQLKY